MKDPLTESDYEALAAEKGLTIANLALNESRGLTLATLRDLVFGDDGQFATDEELISEVRGLVEYCYFKPPFDTDSSNQSL